MIFLPYQTSLYYALDYNFNSSIDLSNFRKNEKNKEEIKTH